MIFLAGCSSAVTSIKTGGGHQLSASGSQMQINVCVVNPLSPNSDKSEISLYIVTTCSNIQVMRIEEVITKARLS